jgi:hypothetical protein
VPEFDRYLLLFLKLLRGPGDQFPVIFDYIADVIGQLSGPIGNIVPFFQDGDLSLR